MREGADSAVFVAVTAATVAVVSDTNKEGEVCSVCNNKSNECQPIPTAPTNNNDETVTDPTVSNLPAKKKSNQVSLVLR